MWPGLHSVYLGLSLARAGTGWYIAWFYVYRTLFALAAVYFATQQYIQVVIYLNLALANMMITWHWRPFQYGHNLALELLNGSFALMTGMLLYCYTPFMVDPGWRRSVSTAVAVELCSIIAANTLIMIKSVMWQVYWKIDQE